MISATAALTELVALKVIEDRIVDLMTQPYTKVEIDRLEDEYRNRAPLAWENARLALRLSQVDWQMRIQS